MLITDELREKLDWPLTQLGLPVRILNNLENLKAIPCRSEQCPAGPGKVHRFLYIRDILEVRPDCLKTMDNVGEKTLKLLLERLAKLGFRAFNPATDVLPEPVILPPAKPPESPIPNTLKRFRFGAAPKKNRRRRR
jgi:hypothetical protein